MVRCFKGTIGSFETSDAAPHYRRAAMCISYAFVTN